MKKIIGIISADPNSINSEIIAKVWKKKRSFAGLNILIIGNFLLLKKQFTKMGYNFPLHKMNGINKINFKNKLNIFDVPLKFKDPFSVSRVNKVDYIKNSFEIGLDLIDRKKIIGLINCAINKNDFQKKEKFYGITEFLAKKKGIYGKEAMIIYNNSLSVSPVTTHIKLKSVANEISKKKIVYKITSINNFFKKKLKKTAKIGVLGLNPHNDELKNNSEEKKIIIPAIKLLKKRGVLVYGPISPDTAFINYKNKGINVLVGMYHDQVLTPFKAIFKFNAINVTAGLPFVRVSPDHGVGIDIIKKNKANPSSLLDSINFFKTINA
tara:strand:+ start:243 stop:1214 length:972 start_codon:yes stop_codon:yes gene_type:complete